MRDIEKLYLSNLQFFADKEEKTEQPTQQKKKKSREEGQVPKSIEISTAVLFLTIFPALKIFLPSMMDKIKAIFYYCYAYISMPGDNYDSKFISEFLNYMFKEIMLLLAPVFAIVVLIGVAVNFAQVGWKPTAKPMAPKFNKINPISGFKRMFSMKALVELLKSLAKVAIIAIIFYTELVGQINRITELFFMDLYTAMAEVGKISMSLAMKTGLFMAFVAAADYGYNRYSHTKSIKMTKQEVKEEYKNQEGDPHVKSAIKRKMQEVSMRRMMQDVPRADVVITNPTHYAVAIKYDRLKADAPYVIAKGVDHVAKRIKDIAKDSNVEIVENKQLARALYATVDINQVIPQDLYQAVAEVLSFVYNLKKKAQ